MYRCVQLINAELIEYLILVACLAMEGQNFSQDCPSPRVRMRINGLATLILTLYFSLVMHSN